MLGASHLHVSFSPHVCGDDSLRHLGPVVHVLRIQQYQTYQSSSSSYHQTILFHGSAHCFPTSLNIIRSSKEQGCASWEHCNMCVVVSSAFPQAHVVSPVKNFHFFLCALLQVYPMCRRLRHLHVVHGLS